MKVAFFCNVIPVINLRHWNVQTFNTFFKKLLRAWIKTKSYIEIKWMWNFVIYDLYLRVQLETIENAAFHNYCQCRKFHCFILAEHSHPIVLRCLNLLLHYGRERVKSVTARCVLCQSRNHHLSRHLKRL